MKSSNCASTLLKYLFAQFVNEDKHSSHKSFLTNFKHDLKINFGCKNQHSEALYSSGFILELKQSKSIEKSISNFFAQMPEIKRCNDCGSKRTIKQSYLTKVPNILIYTFEVFDKS